MSKKRNKNDEELLKGVLERVLIRSSSPLTKMDKEDYAYALAHAYFSMHQQELRDDDLYEKGKKVGKLDGISWSKRRLDIKVKYKKPSHSLVIVVDLDELGKEDEDDLNSK